MKDIIVKCANKIMNARTIRPFIRDDQYLRIMYSIRIGHKLDLDNPVTFNEKLQWLKLHDKKPIYTKMVDKYEAKKYVARMIGEEHIIPTLGIYDSFDDIDFDKLPNQFVMKCTHDSGGLVVCRDKSLLNKNAARRKINKCLKSNYYYNNREWPYKNVKPRIIIEKYMSNDEKGALSDYKFFCFNGEPKIILVCTERFSNNGLRETWFDKSFKRLDFTEGGHSIDLKIKKPKQLTEMLTLSRLLSKKIPFIRVDFYVIDNKVYFGELTFFPASGYEKFDPEEWDAKIGEWIDLSSVKGNASLKESEKDLK